MRKFSTVTTEFTKSEARRLGELASMCLQPFTDRCKNPELAAKIINPMLHGSERIWPQERTKGVFSLLREVYDIISGQIHELTEQLPNIPENSDGLIARPRDVYKSMIENYTQQKRMIKEIQDIFSTPTEEEEDEYTGQKEIAE